MPYKIYISITLVFVYLSTKAQIETFKQNQYIEINGKYEMLNISDLEYYPIVENTLTIKYKPIATSSQIQIFEASNNLTYLRKAETGWYDYTTPTNINIFEKANTFLNNNIIENVEIPKYGRYTSTPNDDHYNNQWYLNPSSSITIDIENAWDITTGSPDVIVAIVDSGTDWTHVDLGLGTDGYQNIYLNPGEDSWSNPNDPNTGNGIDDDNNGYIDDWKGYDFENENNDSRAIIREHGTHVAGIVSAKTNNNLGVAGVAGGWNNEGVNLLICQFGDFIPIGSVADDAILYAAQMGADVIQMSFGGPESEAIIDAIEMVYNNYGVTIVCASGNAGNDSVSFPSNHEYVISVGATNQNDERWTDSNYGTGLFISAPGIDIFNLDFDNYYTFLNGTSHAAPIVSGVIALMYSVNPCLTQEQVKLILKETAEKVGGYDYNWKPSDPGHSLELGYGRVNAYQAVLLAQSMNSENLDLYIKDSPDDYGYEPNEVTEHMWTSQDIWIRNVDDNGLTHQNPEYKENGNPNYIYVRAINKSCATSLGTETLTINWAKANTALSYPQNWDGTLQIEYPLGSGNFYPLGAEFPEVTIPVVQPGGEVIVKIPWVIPNPIHYSDNENPWHFCVLATIDSTLDPMGTYTSNPNIMVRNNNNQAWKNLTVVDLVADRVSGSVLIANPSNTPRNFLLELQKESNETGKAIFDEAEVSLKMDSELFNAWVRGGKENQKLDSTKDEKRKIVTADNAILDNIAFNPNEMGLLTLEFNFLTEEITDKNQFTYHIIQKDVDTDEIIGGETFVIQKESRVLFLADAGEDKEVDLNQTVTLSAEDINEPALYNWYDSEGNLIYQGKDLTVTADMVKQYKLEVIATTDSYKDYTSVEVEIKPGHIESIAPNPSSYDITVNYKTNGANSAYLMIVGCYGSDTAYNHILDENDEEISIDINHIL